LISTLENAAGPNSPNAKPAMMAANPTREVGAATFQLISPFKRLLAPTTTGPSNLGGGDDPSVGTRFHASIGMLGLAFFGIGILQMLSFVAATALAERFGLLSTMVFTHLPSNLLLAAIGFAPNLAVGLALLVARSSLSSMDVPTRHAYVMGLVEPEERTAAAGYTNTARYLARPLGPVLAGAGQGLFVGLPFVLAGAIKAGYELALWRWFRTVDLPDDAVDTALGSTGSGPAASHLPAPAQAAEPL
jgi:MFS family permease